MSCWCWCKRSHRTAVNYWPSANYNWAQTALVFCVLSKRVCVHVVGIVQRVWVLPAIFWCMDDDVSSLGACDRNYVHLDDRTPHSVPLHSDRQSVKQLFHIRRESCGTSHPVCSPANNSVLWLCVCVSLDDHSLTKRLIGRGIAELLAIAFRLSTHSRQQHPHGTQFWDEKSSSLSLTKAEKIFSPNLEQIWLLLCVWEIGFVHRHPYKDSWSMDGLMI